MPLPYSDAFLGGGAIPRLEDEALLPATIGTSTLAMPGDRALDASLRRPGAYDVDQTPRAGLTAAVVPPPVPVPGASPEMQAKALAAVAPPPPPQAPTPQEAARAALNMGPQQPAPPPPKKAGGGGFKSPYGSQAGEHLGALADEGQADQMANYAQAEALQRRALLLDEQRDQSEARMAERAASRARRDAAIDQQMQDLDSRISEASSQAYDSGKYFAQPGTMLMNIGAALGGGAAARVTGRNDAQAVLERGIDRDFQAWKANADQKQNATREKANLISQMRATYQDRDQADLAAEVIHREMAASAIEAEAMRSKVPEIQAQGLKLAAGVRERTATIKDKYNAIAVQAAQAAEARRRADEKEAFDRGLNVYKATTDRIKAEGGEEGGPQKGASRIAERLQTANIPQTETSARRADASLDKLGPWTANPVSNYIAEKAPLLYRLFAGEDASNAQMSIADFRNQARKAVAGSSLSEGEKAALDQSLVGAGTVGSMKVAISNAIERSTAGRANVMAGESPAAQARYREQYEAQAPTQSPSAPPGFTPGVQ